jgi:hypothetical protein
VPTYHLGKKSEFTIGDYNLAKPWASFFPGIAGLFGIPLWVFYVNRGQCIASVGICTKDEAIMEFLPANKAYQLTATHGFRTFIKVKSKFKAFTYEPFVPAQNALNPRLKNKMLIRPFDLKIVEENPDAGLAVEVSYFSLPNSPYAALVRQVTIKNISKKILDLEFLDGLALFLPYGVNNWFLKEMGRTIEAWMNAENVKEGIQLYRLTTDPRDSAQVAFVKGAHFYLGFAEGKEPSVTKVIVDPQAIFGQISDLTFPLEFFKAGPFVYPSQQVAKNKTPCAFSFERLKLSPGGQKRFYSLIGHVFDVNDVKKYKLASIDEAFIAKKKLENQELIDGIMDRIFTVSGVEAFDLYARQTYLDNVLRGGLPVSLSTDANEKNVYVFSRKHGDLERDYNHFSLSSTYFSEGEGNYRDVNQNRRSDIFFNPSVAEHNIVAFLNLIQLDGYNPLIFKGERFVIAHGDFLKSGLSKRFCGKEAHKLAHILSKPFSLGEILRYLEENKITPSCPLKEFVKELLLAAHSTQEAVFGEGYWSDHWTYNTDHLESFYAVYPDATKELLLEKDDFTYFDSYAFVKPRAERYCIQHGEVRQYHSIFVDEEKNVLIQKRHEDKYKVRFKNSDGVVFKTTMLDKLLCLVVNKLATLDPFGVGIEMEAGKPDWYDALNGLPGLLGSSISETFELKRLIRLLGDLLTALKIPETEEVPVFFDLFGFFNEMRSLLQEVTSDFDFWDRSNAIKEAYRDKVRHGVSGEPFQKLKILEIREFFDLALKKIDAGIAKSLDKETGAYTTYFIYKMTKHEPSVDVAGKHHVQAKEFQQVKLPLFLEGFVHALRTETRLAPAIYETVRKSALWDKKLKMYKVNASLAKESFEIGRAKAFTPGWLENESVWLHMEYKYLLELLKNQLYEEFYEDFFRVLIPFHDPKIYGRSILENSSFIVSSVHPDSSLHGTGFVARLSGSTAEFIHMWLLMNVGPAPFFLDGSGKLALRLRPSLSWKLFIRKPAHKSYLDASGIRTDVALKAKTYSFLFLSKALVSYLNPRMKNTFGREGVVPSRITLFAKNKVVAEVKGNVVKAPYSEWVRQGKIDRIDVLLDK